MNSVLEQWKKQGHFFDFNGQQIFYRDEGKGVPLICIHGFPTSSWDWRYIIPEIQKIHRVITLDMLGFGFSDKPQKHQYSIIEQADIHEALLSILGVYEYHILAHDFGTIVAQELLSRVTHSIPIRPKPLSLFAMSGSIFPELSKPRLIQKLLISQAGLLITKLFNEKKFSQSLSRVFSEQKKPNTSTLNTYWQLLSTHQGNKILHKLNFFLKDRKTHGEKWSEAWQTSSLPVCYLSGDEDPMYGKNTLIRLTEISHKKEITSLAGVGHFPHIEEPEVVVRHLIDFLSSPKIK
jgi:pimeloyl-ACP methyl ester carboxylesterase